MTPESIAGLTIPEEQLQELIDALADFVQRFQRDTGIGARFVTQLDHVALTPRACREVARILEEALVNVRRHSGARPGTSGP